jgi:hypothetical protein
LAVPWDAVCRSYSIRRDGGTIKIKMFAEQLRIENMEAVTQRNWVAKHEPPVVTLKDVTVNQDAVMYEYVD